MLELRRRYISLKWVKRNEKCWSSHCCSQYASDGVNTEVEFSKGAFQLGELKKAPSLTWKRDVPPLQSAHRGRMKRDNLYPNLQSNIFQSNLIGQLFWLPREDFIEEVFLDGVSSPINIYRDVCNCAEWNAVKASVTWFQQVNNAVPYETIIFQRHIYM